MDNKIFLHFEKFFRIGFIAFYSVLLARYLGINKVGEHALLFALFNVFVAIFTFGGEVIFSSTYKSLDKRKIQHLFVIRLIGFSIIILPAVVIIIFSFGYSLFESLLLCISSGVAVINFADLITIRSGAFRFYFVVSFFVSLVGFLIKFFLLLYNIDLVYKIALDGTEIAVINYIVIKHRFVGFKFFNRLKPRNLTLYLYKIKFLIFSNLLSFGAQRLDIFLASRILSNVELGIYSIATQIFALIIQIASTYTYSYMNEFSIRSNSPKKLMKLTLYLIFVSWILMSTFIALWALFGKFFLSFVFGPDSLPAYAIIFSLYFYYLSLIIIQIVVQNNIVRSNYSASLYRSVLYIVVLPLSLMFVGETGGLQALIFGITIASFCSIPMLIFGLFLSFKK